jgi:hypothetical protein
MRFDHEMSVWTSSLVPELAQGTGRTGVRERRPEVGLGAMQHVGFASAEGASGRAGHDKWCPPDPQKPSTTRERSPGQYVPLVAKKAHVVVIVEDLEFATY